MDITSLVQSVNLICAKKVYYSNRPKYVFLCVNSRITSNLLKTCFGQNEKVWMDEKLVTIFRVFFKENVRNPVWICTDPISLILGIQFFYDFRDPMIIFSDSRDPI